jgi:hypothetical protein
MDENNKNVTPPTSPYPKGRKENKNSININIKIMIR